MLAFVLVAVCAATVHGTVQFAAAVEGEDSLARSLLGDSTYSYDYQSDAPSFEECTAQLTDRVAQWMAQPHKNSNPPVSTFPEMFTAFSQRTGCFQEDGQQSAGNETFELLLYADLTWGVALERQALRNLVGATSRYSANLTMARYFNCMADLKAQPSFLSSASSFYYSVDREAQNALYVGGLASTVWGSATSPYYDDNAPVLATSAGLLYPRTYMMLLYREDVLSALDLPIPNTWDDLISVARAVQGSSFSGADPATGGYGICLDLAAMCKSNFYLMAIAASIMQYEGLAQGLWLDPGTLAPLMNNSAMEEAFRIFNELKALSPPGSDTSCMAWNEHFDQGRCAMTLEWDVNLHFMTRDTAVKGLLGVALLPGSIKVLVRSTNTLTPCTDALCPHATLETILSQPLPPPPAVNGNTTNPGHRRRRRALAAVTTQVLVNRAPYSTFGSFDSSVTSLQLRGGSRLQCDITAFVKSYTLPFAVFLTRRQQVLSQAVRDLAPGSSLVWHAPPATWNASIQGAANYSDDDLEAYYPQLWKARWHPNPAADIAIAGAMLFRVALEEAIHNVTVLGQAPHTVLPVLAKRFPLVISFANDSRAINRYRRSLGITTLLSPPPGRQPPAAAPSSGAHSTLALATAIPISVFVMLLLGLAVLTLYRRHLNLTVLGKVVAPGIGPDTTLMCTDIQNSTLLWETLDAAVMDASVNTHNDVLRRCLYRNTGYLSAMEGDSFIIAFHDARSAILFAVEAQLDLLKADWSPELLATADCQPVWVAHRREGVVTKSVSERISNASAQGLGLVTQHLLPAACWRWLPCFRGKARQGVKFQRLDTGVDAEVAEWAKSLGLRRSPGEDGAAGGGQSRMGGGGDAQDPHSLLPTEVSGSGEGDEVVAGLLGVPAKALTPAASLPPPLTKRLSSLGLSLQRRMEPATATQQSRPQVEFGMVQHTGRGVVGRASPLRPPTTSRPNVDRIAPLFRFKTEADMWGEVSRQRASPPGAGRASVRLGTAPQHASDRDADVSVAGRSTAAAGGGGTGCSPYASNGNVTLELSAPEREDSSVSCSSSQGMRMLMEVRSTNTRADYLSQALRASAVVSEIDSEALPDITGASRASCLRMEIANGDNSAVAAGGALGAPPTPCTWQQLMAESLEVTKGCQSEPPSPEPRRGRSLVFNGLRVRMGLYSGITSLDDIVFNQAAGNVQYSGEPLEAAKTVAGAAEGGMILLAGETYRRVVPQDIKQQALLLYAGDYHLDAGRRPWVMYQAAPMALPQRMALCAPVQCLTTLQSGTPSAPVGVVTIVFMYVIGASTLLAEIPEDARAALALFHTIVAGELLRWGGYLVEAVDGLILAAFSNVASAASWGLASHEAMLSADWSSELLSHECCELVTVVQKDPHMALLSHRGSAESHPMYAERRETGLMGGSQVCSLDPGDSPSDVQVQVMTLRRRVLMRGLRLKVGLDVGRPMPDINPGTGRMQYRGRVMNRAARIASKASAGQVVCSCAAWREIQREPSRMPSAAAVGPLMADSLGMFTLKGISEPLELFSCMHGETLELLAFD